jgi:ABC-type polysaccharide/polyol phosphate export permease
VGIVHWNYFVSATSDSFGAILKRDDYLTAFSFPCELLVIASVIGSSLSYVVQMVLVTFFSYFLSGGWSCLVLLLPIFMLMHILFVLGTSFALVSLHTYFRDMDYLWSIILRLTIFVTPVFFSIDMVGGKQKIFLLLNPMLYILNVARAIIAQRQISSMRDMIIAILISIIIFIVGIMMFRKSSKRFPELA